MSQDLSVIRVSYVPFFPMVNPDCPRITSARATSRCLLPGIAIEILDLLTTYLNVTIEAQWRDPPYSNDYSYIFDGLRNNITDTYAYTFEESDVRKNEFAFTNHMYYVNTYYAVRKADHSLKNIFDFFNVYQWDAWLSMFGVFVFFTLFGLCVRFTEWRLMLRSDRQLLDTIWRMVRFQLIQSDGIEYKLRAGRASLLVFSLFQLCIVLGLFQGFILSSVVKHKKSVPFDSVDFPRLLKEGKFYIVTSTTLDSFYLEIESSFASPFYELREAKQFNPYRIVDFTTTVLDTILKDEHAVTLVQDDQALIFDFHKHCEILLINAEMFPGIERLMFRKDSPWLPLFNKAIVDNRLLLRRIYNKYAQYRPPTTCHELKKGPLPLTMGPYYGVLILFTVGILSAFLIFGAEMLKQSTKSNDVYSVNKTP